MHLVRKIICMWDPTCWLANGKPREKVPPVDWSTVKRDMPAKRDMPPGILSRQRAQKKIADRQAAAAQRRAQGKGTPKKKRKQ